ncbi:MAG: hypothetical protein FWC00_00635 [Firmicutes bacterium]|nr:hypothetical protein [Bacillota bacterium]
MRNYGKNREGAVVEETLKELADLDIGMSYEVEDKHQIVRTVEMSLPGDYPEDDIDDTFSV